MENQWCACHRHSISNARGGWGAHRKGNKMQTENPSFEHMPVVQFYFIFSLFFRCSSSSFFAWFRYYFRLYIRNITSKRPIFSTILCTCIRYTFTSTTYAHTHTHVRSAMRMELLHIVLLCDIMYMEKICLLWLCWRRQRQRRWQNNGEKKKKKTKWKMVWFCVCVLLAARIECWSARRYKKHSANTSRSVFICITGQGMAAMLSQYVCMCTV